MAEKFNQLEELYKNLLQMTGFNEEKSDTENRQDKPDFASLKREIAELRNDMDKRFNEIMVKLTELEHDHEHTWEKTVRNERDIARIKSNLKE